MKYFLFPNLSLLALALNVNPSNAFLMSSNSHSMPPSMPDAYDNIGCNLDLLPTKREPESFILTLNPISKDWKDSGFSKDA